ncbi:E3 ubiquitin-protein ligase TRIM38-like [Sorex araneus]|uniref:E3 ubiquitin-protein ligase TRIM38-like n=1 Tax=Sorex araneus TaxID=42254 RepID=UPI0024338F29|nr:E3 ubiquitin-protein ligase TRIM38-like [Sorex araneus]
MASGTTKTMKEEATCPICLQLMTEPISIDCGHFFCCSCIMQNIENEQQQSLSQGIFWCPVCRAQFQRESFRPSKQLESIIDTIKKMEQEHLCEEHGEKLSLFCEDDGQLICWLCERKPQHKGHTTVLAEDVCQGYREIFQETLTSLRDQEIKNKEWQGNISEKIEKVESEFLHEKNRFMYRFAMCHVILYMEEKSYLRRLENKKEEVLKTLQGIEAQLVKQSQELNKHILELERKCQGSVQELLQDVTDTLDRISAMKSNAPEDVSWALHAKSERDRIFSQFLKMFKTAYVTVTVDPDTAHNNLLVNKDKDNVTHGSAQVKHETPARFKDLPCVLGCEAFNSGKQFFVIYTVSGPEWDVGVCRENVPRDNCMRRNPESGFWAIRHCKDYGYVALTNPLTPLPLKNVFNIGVFVDYEAGLVSFNDLNTRSHIFTFQKASFSEPIRPYFRIGEDSALYSQPAKKK